MGTQVEVEVEVGVFGVEVEAEAEVEVSTQLEGVLKSSSWDAKVEVGKLNLKSRYWSEEIPDSKFRRKQDLNILPATQNDGGC